MMMVMWFSAEYNAFGEVLDESNTGATNRLGYQSNWLTLKDSGNELVISPARVYSAKLGRFLQKDFLFQMTLLRQQGSYRNSIFRGRQRSLFSVDNFGLYEAFSGNSYSYSDAMGLTTWILNGIKVELENPSEQFVNQVKINSSLHPDLHNFAVRARIIWATKKAFEAIEGMSDFLDNQLPNLSVSGISSAMKEPTIRNQFKQRYQDLWQKIKKSEIKIKFGGIVCDDDPDCNFYTLGEPNKPLDRTIGICSRAVNNEIDKLAAAIVHELLHIFFGLEDPREYASDGSNGQSVIFEPSKNTIYGIDADGNRFLLEQAGSYRFDQNGVPFASPLDDPEAYEIYTYQYLHNNK
ncbi:hypothetical protein [Candidatus Uabimicrobium sp. HlEnr_7]|uniref:hypothetical protein n=1 Tax=Candidatus Uabimicrobium helgolandensis TaxID=3095367 RepID=UPI003557D86B